MTSAPPISRSSAPDLREARLRANPAYELVLLDRLPEAQQRALRGLSEDPDCYGVLRGREGFGLAMKAVSRETALLLFSLQIPGPLPRFAAHALGAQCDATIAKMVLDGVLEIERDGRMLSGPAAREMVCAAVADAESEEVDPGPLAALSRRALEYAAALELTAAPALAARLYAYNTIPASRRWLARLPTEQATAEYLGLENGPAARLLAAAWRPLPASEAWISWRSTLGTRSGASSDAESSACKLYVSPACESLREAMFAVADAVASSNAFQWKVGRGPRGLLRPDKMVVYFHRFSDLQETALKVMARLDGCPAHGVPFTAELGGAGLLSWGADPPFDPPSDPHSAQRSGPWREAESWRGKICNRLALALVQAGNLARGEAARFAIERLRLEGVDPGSWSPNRMSVWSA